MDNGEHAETYVLLVGNSNTAETVYAYVEYEPEDSGYLKT